MKLIDHKKLDAMSISDVKAVMDSICAFSRDSANMMNSEEVYQHEGYMKASELYIKDSMHVRNYLLKRIQKEIYQ